jgi:dTDP-4-amino-4,6-dideoxygalactose transaminase
MRTSAAYRVPLGRPAAEWAAVESDVRRAFDAIMKRAVFRDGPELAALERSLAGAFGQEHAIGVNSGSLALTIALTAIGVGPGDVVVTVANMDVSLSSPIVHSGGTLRWIDIDPATLTLAPDDLEGAVPPEARAIIVPHSFGNPADLASILAFARRRGIHVIEDVTHGPGASFRGAACGSWADVAVLSLTAGKPLGAAGMAGVILTRDARVAEKSRCLVNYGLNPGDLRDVHDGVPNALFRARGDGFNGILDEWQAAVLRAKLRRLESWARVRREQAEQYREGFRDCPPRSLLLQRSLPGADPVPRHFVVRTPRRRQLQQHLQKAGIASAVRYNPPLHRQPIYRSIEPHSLPETERAARRSVCLPLHPALTPREIGSVVREVKKFLLADAQTASRRSDGEA